MSLSPLHARSWRPLTLALLAVLGLFALGAPAAMADVLTPESGGSSNANDIDTLYKIVLGVALAVFIGVEGLLVYSLIKFKARKGAVAAQIHGNTPLEIGWTVGTAIVLLALCVVTFVMLGDIKNPPSSGPGGLRSANGTQFASTDRPAPPSGKGLRILVNGQQFIWRYTYPDGDRDPVNNVFAYEEMVVPEDTTVLLDIESQDVAHSWWIPKLGGKFDALPGYTNKTWFKATQPGLFIGQCAELCGRNHANMSARVRVLPVTEYEAWYQDRKRDLERAKNLTKQGLPELDGAAAP